MEHELLELDDAYQLAFLLCTTPSLEEDLEFVVQNGRTTAVLPANTAVYDLLRRYNGGEKVSAIFYSRLIKKVRGQFIEKRRNGNERVIRNGYSSHR
jgi:hypothetical protein